MGSEFLAAAQKAHADLTRAGHVIDPPRRSEPVDPADIRVGDVVEVEADDGSWVVRGEVARDGSVQGADEYAFQVRLGPDDMDVMWIETAHSTVRVVRRAEPLDLRDEHLSTIRHHVDRLEAWCRDETRDNGQALGGIVADLRRAVGTEGRAMSEQEPQVHTVTLPLCDLCLDGHGGECHTPGCALWMNRAPDVPIRDKAEVLADG